ncbi:hypothetical protein LWI28_023392 [Acer negundo]|uniref:MAPK kinase substrate protein n=1 Tax=Acer negundo TaxID=4023 RepID=A0AAD5IG27_ACENE|nr:hypothetical protein LWI28_023392 [Acer negundo]
MEGLQRSAVSFRRQGSSGLIWDDKFLAELNQATKQKEEQDQLQPEQQHQQDSQPPEHEKAEADADNNIKEVKPSISINTTTTTTATTIERSRSNGGGRGFRTGRVSPAIEPPSPRLSACGFCSAFAKPSKTLTKKSENVGLVVVSLPWDEERATWNLGIWDRIIFKNIKHMVALASGTQIEGRIS